MARILGLDFGTRRVGAALADPRGRIATPLEVYARRDPKRDAEHYGDLVRRHEVDRLVVGLPVHTGGGEGESARLARAWGAWLGAATGLPVVFADERYSTVEAEEAMRAAGLKASERRTRVDMLAARLLLQDYLDAGCPPSLVAPEPIEDAPEAGDRTT